MDKWSVIQYLERRAEDFYKLSDKIWENAEIRFKEKQSVKELCCHLKKLLPVEKHLSKKI